MWHTLIHIGKSIHINLFLYILNYWHILKYLNFKVCLIALDSLLYYQYFSFVRTKKKYPSWFRTSNFSVWKLINDSGMNSGVSNSIICAFPKFCLLLDTWWQSRWRWWNDLAAQQSGQADQIKSLHPAPIQESHSHMKPQHWEGGRWKFFGE